MAKFTGAVAVITGASSGIAVETEEGILLYFSRLDQGLRCTLVQRA